MLRKVIELFHEEFVMEELMLKITKAINTKPFIGKYIFSDEELNKMYEITASLLRDYDCNRYRNTISQKYDQLMFVAIVNASKAWMKDEGTFWDTICKKMMGTGCSPKVRLYLTSVIDRLGKNDGILYLKNCRKKYYATVLAHAFSPVNSTESFFELCWDLYSKDMNFTYVKDDDIFELIIEELKRTFSNEESVENDIKFGSEVYSLRAGITQSVIYAKKEMREYVESTICFIDKMFYGGILNNNDYFEVLISNWWLKKEKTFGISKPKKKHYKRAVTDYNLIRPKYIVSGEQACLLIPSIRLKNNFYDMPYLNILCNGKLVRKEEMRTFGSGITMATKEISLDIAEFVDEDSIELSVEIVHCNEVVYNSNTNLYREFLLFRNEREILQDECLPGNYILFTKKIEKFSSYPINIRRMTNCLYTFNSEEGEVLQNRKRIVFFSNEKQNRNIKFDVDKKNNIKFVSNGEAYSVIDGEINIDVESDIDITEYGIRYETTDFRLNEFKYTEHNGLKSFQITELLNIYEPQKISVFSYIDNKIQATFNVVKFNGISVFYDKTLYFGDENTGIVRVETERYVKNAAFDISQGDIVIPLDNGDIILSPPVLRWKIDDCKFSTQDCGDIWYKKYSNSAELSIELPNWMSYKVVLSNNTVLTENTNKFNSFKLGETICNLSQNGIADVVVFVKIDNVGNYPLFTMCLKEKLKFSPFVVDGKNFLWDSSKAFVGGSSAMFKVYFKENNELKECFEFEDTFDKNYENRLFLLDKLDDGLYDVSVDLIKRNVFFEETERLLERQIILGDINKIRFKNKCLRFEKVMLTSEISYRKIQRFYVDCIEYMGEEEGCLYYIGNVYIINQNGYKTYLNKMKNSEGEFDKTNPIRIELKDENTCFVVAGVNPKDKHDFLGEFTLDTKNKISNFDKYTKGIDYFLFEKEEVKHNV